MTIETLERLCAERKSRDDLPHTMTIAEVNAYCEATARYQRQLVTARSAAHALATLPTTEADVRWLGQLNAWLAILTDELLAFKSPIRDPKVLGQQTNVRLSVRTIHHGPAHALRDTGYELTTLRLGALMRDAGFEVVGADLDHNYAGQMPWYGSLPEVEARIAKVEARRAAAQSQLDDALLDDDERERRDAEAKARVDALNALPTRKTRADGSQYDKYPDGRRVEVSG